MDLSFDEEKHEYRIDGTVVPSVTQCLKQLYSLDGIPPDVLERKRKLGSMVHRTIELHHKGRLNRASLHPTLESYLAQWESAIKFLGIKVRHCELRLGSKPMMVAGTIDVIGDDEDGELLVEVKTSDFSRWHQIQTAGYHALAVENGIINRTARRLSVHLSEGEHEIRWHNGWNDSVVFMSAVNIERWRREK